LQALRRVRVTSRAAQIICGFASATSWTKHLVLQHPFPALNLHHHPSARVEPEMIGLAHRDRAISNFQASGLLQRLA
jgi:hypothetical protein